MTGQVAAVGAEFLSPIDRYGIILRVSQAIASESTREALFRAITQVFKDGFPFDCTGITLYVPDRDVFLVTAVEPYSSSVELSAGYELSPDDSHSGWVYTHGQPFIAQDLEQEQRFGTDRMMLEQGIRSYIVVPLTTPGGERIGTFNVGCSLPDRYSDDDLDFVNLVATQIAMATECATGHEELTRREEELQTTKESVVRKEQAIQEFLDHIAAERHSFRHKICTEVRVAVTPFLESLRQHAEVELAPKFDRMQNDLNNVLSLGLDHVRELFSTLTPREQEVAALIVEGMTSKKIANHLYLAVVTVQTHRESIRQKLNLSNKNINLTTYLRTHRESLTT
jgi:DNA-binding NarL/FixJ family response regulator